VAERVLRALVVGPQLEHALEGAHRLLFAQQLVGEQLALFVVEVGAAVLVGLDAELEIDEPHDELEVAALAMHATRFAERAAHRGVRARFFLRCPSSVAVAAPLGQLRERGQRVGVVRIRFEGGEGTNDLGVHGEDDVTPAV